MRIGLVTGEYPPMRGGVGAFTRILALHLHELGHQVFIFTRADGRESDPRLPLTNGVTRWRRGALRAAAQWARDHHLDVINLQFQTAAFGMSPFIHFLPDALRPFPVVTTFHDLRHPYLFPKAGPLRDWMVMRLAQASRGVIVTNHEDRERLAHLPSIELIPIGSNIAAARLTDARKMWRHAAGAAANDFLLAYFGLLNRSKGVETLFMVLPALHAENIPARLVVIGDATGTSDPSNAAYVRELHELMNGLGIRERIHFTGHLDEADVSAYLHAADVVVLPFRDGASYRRGSLIAAIHHGCAIVTTTPRVPVPTFLDNENMRFFAPSDSAGLAFDLRRLYNAPAQRERLREGARALAETFDWRTIARATADFFARVREAK